MSGRSSRDDDDRRFMKLALALAERGRGQTRPNPIVGAVLVKGGRILARGYHRRAGGAHAEVDVLAKVDRRKTRGATLYVTLEPCCHVGRTGPCTRPIIDAGIERVVVGCGDPNPLVSGRGIATLERAGVRVDVGCREVECRAANRAFFRWIAHGRPWVTLKAAATLDGFIAPPPGRRTERWITGPAARRVAHEMRAAHDAVLVGAGTVLADDPRLDVRLPGRPAHAGLRVVLDGNLSTPPRARLLRVRGRPPPLIVAAAGDATGRPGATRRSFRRRLHALQKAGADVMLLRGDRNGRLPLRAVLRALARRGVQSLLVEGGSRIHGQLVAAGTVDEVAMFVAPVVWGAGLPVAAAPKRRVLAPLPLGPLRVRRLGGDILLTAEVIGSVQQKVL